MIVSESPRIELIQGDCMKALEQMKENQFDLAIVDPPYRDKNQPNYSHLELKNLVTIKRVGKEHFCPLFKS